MNQLELKLKQYIRRHCLVTYGQSVLLAVSGGVDSMAMLRLFSSISRQMKIHLSVVHVNHQLRGRESLEDENFVKKMSDAAHIPYYCEHVDVMSYVHKHKLSKQDAARRLRYECFERVRRRINADAVATAHHADDNAETVLLNILRGTGIHGLAGIPPKRLSGNIIRPLLFATRAEIAAYTVKNSIDYREDSSNKSLVYRRNYLRHRILPVLRERTPDIVKTLNKIADKMYSVNENMHMLVDEKIQSLVYTDNQGCLILDMETIKEKPEFLQSEIFVEILNRLHVEPTEEKVDALCRLCELPTGRTVQLSGTLSAWRNRNNIVFRMKVNHSNMQYVELGESYDYNGYHISISGPEPVPAKFAKTRVVEYVDAERLGRQLVLRSWRAGDWFIPLGMKRKKKLSDFFTDQKVPRYQKAAVPILESDGVIVWICGKRLDDRFKLTDRTRMAIRLTIQQLT